MAKELHLARYWFGVCDFDEKRGKKNPPSPLQIAEWVYICMQVGRVKRKQDGRLGLKIIRKQSLWFGRMSWLQREKDYSLEKYHEETNAEGLHAH